MLITTEQLGSLYEMSALDVLDNSTYLDESEALLNPIAVPVLENTRLDICTVLYKDIQKVCEDYGCYTNEALNSIAESSNVDIDHIAVAIDESDIILDPSIINEFYQYTIIPESDYSIPSVFVEACLDNYIGSNFDEDYLDIMVEPEQMVDSLNYYQEGSLTKKIKKNKKDQPEIPGMPTADKPLNPIPGRGRSYTPSWGQPKSHIGTNVDVLAGSIGNIKKKIKSETDRELNNQDFEHAPTVLAAIGKDRAKTIGTGEVLRKGIVSSTTDTDARLGLGLAQKVADDKAEKEAAKKKEEERRQAKQQEKKEKYENVKDTTEEIDTNNKENNKTSDNTQTSSTSSQSSTTNPKPATSSGSSKGGNSSRGRYSSSTSTTKKPTSNNSPAPGNPQDPGFMTKLKRYIVDKPREFLAKMAAKLRNVYKQWLEKAKQESNAGKASFIKKIAAKILQAVDYIMRKIQGTKE